MDTSTPRSIKLEVHETRDVNDKHVNGSLTVVWRDWDKIFNFDPRMVYVSYVEPGEIKGPHLHLKRTSYFVCILGKVVFVIKDDKGKYHEIESSEKSPVLVQVPNNLPCAHINLSNHTSAILVLADIAWKPNDNEMINALFDDYDWNKWKECR